ncbi:hypothetical protein ACFQU7_02790 [Pseudoroseomonas wenyumeiae]
MAALTIPPPSGEDWSNWNSGWPISKAGRAEAERIGAALAAGRHPPEAFRAAVLRRLAREDRELIAGIAAYRRHPWQREAAEVPVVWEEGGSRLLDFGGTGTPVLVVPSWSTARRCWTCCRAIPCCATWLPGAAACCCWTGAGLARSSAASP